MLGCGAGRATLGGKGVKPCGSGQSEGSPGAFAGVVTGIPAASTCATAAAGSAATAATFATPSAGGNECGGTAPGTGCSTGIGRYGGSCVFICSRASAIRAWKITDDGISPSCGVPHGKP